MSAEVNTGERAKWKQQQKRSHLDQHSLPHQPEYENERKEIKNRIKRKKQRVPKKCPVKTKYSISNRIEWGTPANRIIQPLGIYDDDREDDGEKKKRREEAKVMGLLMARR